MYRMALCCALLAGVASADERDRDRGKGGPPDSVDRLARRLERDARELREEVITHFRRSPLFKDMERHSREVERQAGLVAKLADRDARPRMIREILGKIDDEVRDLDRHVRELARERGIDRKAYDHLRDELTDIGRTLYRIRRELP